MREIIMAVDRDVGIKPSDGERHLKDMELAYERRTSSSAVAVMSSRSISGVPDADAAAEAAELAAAREGDPRAFEAIYRRHVGRVYALCLRMAGNAQEAEELTQDVFVRAWERLHQFAGRSAFGSWLHRLAVNVVLGTWRSRGRRRARVVAFEDVGDIDLEARHHQAGPAHRRRGIDLERAIAGLPTGARTVFVLHDQAGYKHREIAELTGLAIGTSKAQLHRARRLLREALNR